VRDVVRLIVWLGPVKARIVVAVALGLATVVTSTGLLGVATYVVSAAARHPPLAELAGGLYLVRIFGVSRAFARYAERLVSHDITFRVLARLRVWVYGQLARLAPGQLVALRSADLLARLVRDVDECQTVFQHLVGPLAVGVLVVLVVGGGEWLIDARLGLVTVGALLAVGFGVPVMHLVRTRAAQAREIRWRAELDVRIADMVYGLPDLLMAGQAGEHVDATLAVADVLARDQQRLAAARAVSIGIQDGIARLGAWSVLLLAIPLVGANALSAVYVAVLAVLVLGAAEALEPLTHAAERLASTRAAARRLWDIADRRPALTSSAAPASGVAAFRSHPESGAVHGSSNTLELEEVGFAYDGPTVLSEVSLSLAPGRAVGIVGPSGAGKSTLLLLAVRAWDPTHGQVRLDGRDLRTCSADVVRRGVGLLGQDSYVFSSSLGDNVRLACPSATDVELEAALCRAGLRETLGRLPDGLDTWLGDQGARLSGGERQRLCLARMLLLETPFLLLDEPTANLDPVSASEVMRLVRGAARTRGVLLVTHRLEDLGWLDEVLVLDRGRVVERGRPGDLRRAGGLYQRMVDMHEAMLSVPPPCA
jgi:thiol reductant ABC exporter CydC subunit